MAASRTKELSLLKEEISQRYESGESSEKIAKDLGFSATAILKRLKSSGIHIRDNSEKQRGNKNQQWIDGRSLKRGGKVGAQYGEKNNGWKGGRTLHEGKYLKILVDGRGYVVEARLIMEQQLGRKLTEFEFVFHRDKNPLNNSPENLYLMDRASNEEDVAKMYEVYKTGASNQKIGKIFNINPITVTSRLKKYGYKTRAEYKASKPKQKKKAGYIKIYGNEGKIILEHRFVMEQFIGRKLEAYEIVHHRNKNKRDNRIENLVLCSSISEHIGLYHASGKTQEYEKIRKEIFEEQKALEEETTFRHKKIMEEHLKIRLLPGERVLHINGNKLDNSIENLITMRDHEKIKKIYELYQSGCTVAQAAQQFGVSVIWTRRAFDFWGYSLRSKKEQMDLYWEERREKQKKFFEDIEKDEDFGQPL